MEGALEHFREAMELYLLVGDPWGLADCHCGMGRIEQFRGRMEESLKRFEEAKELYLAVQNLRGQIDCLAGQSSVYAQDPNKMVKAIQVSEEAVNLSPAAGKYYEGRSRKDLAQLLFQSSRYVPAREEATRARQLYESCLATADVKDCDDLLHKISQAECK
ncbi:hypothetical protein BT69DRAFT_846651 [Atractiella rhizophila]|nr:hypothetical protein BT69DRAFT_846651 [Atractiella rhizophila]